MKFFLKLTTTVILVLALSLALYLLTPSPEYWSIETRAYPAEPPIKVESEQRCLPQTLYVTKDLQDDDHQVIDLRCFKLQEKLVEAANDGDLVAIRSAIQQGASVNSPSWSMGNLERPLPLAVWSKRTAAVKLLLDNGGNANDYHYCCMDHRSLLTLAVGNNDIETMKLLMARGADINFVGQFGQGVMDEANRVGNDDTKKLIGAAQDRDIRHRISSRTNNLLRLFGLKT